MAARPSEGCRLTRVSGTLTMAITSRPIVEDTTHVYRAINSQSLRGNISKTQEKKAAMEVEWFHYDRSLYSME